MSNRPTVYRPAEWLEFLREDVNYQGDDIEEVFREALQRLGIRV